MVALCSVVLVANVMPGWFGGLKCLLTNTQTETDRPVSSWLVYGFVAYVPRQRDDDGGQWGVIIREKRRERKVSCKRRRRESSERKSSLQFYLKMQRGLNYRRRGRTIDLICIVCFTWPVTQQSSVLKDKFNSQKCNVVRGREVNQLQQTVEQIWIIIFHSNSWDGSLKDSVCSHW